VIKLIDEDAKTIRQVRVSLKCGMVESISTSTARTSKSTLPSELPGTRDQSARQYTSRAAIYHHRAPLNQSPKVRKPPPIAYISGIETVKNTCPSCHLGLHQHEVNRGPPQHSRRQRPLAWRTRIREVPPCLDLRPRHIPSNRSKWDCGRVHFSWP
jgi:hypothetical protein